MLYVLLSILTSTGLVVAFKIFQRFGVSSFQAIVVNYFTAATLGFCMNSDKASFSYVSSQPWLWVCVIMGASFITVFNLTAISTERLGLSVTSVTNKMSMILPITIAVIWLGDSFNWIKLLGVLLALVAVVFTSLKKETEDRPSKNTLMYLLPALVFIGSGACDAAIKIAQIKYLQPADFGLFSAIIFSVAGLIGLALSLYLIWAKKQVFQWKNVLGGICLGIPNFGSMYYLLKALEFKGLESSVVFPVNNMGIIICSALVAATVFGEKLTKLNWLGIGISIVAIALIAFA